MRMNLRSRSSRPTGPKMRVARGSPSSLINAAAFSDLIDQRIAINQPSCEQPDVWDLLFQTDDRNVDVVEAAIEQAVLDWVNLIIGERHPVELRRVSGEEATGDFMGNTAKWIVAV